MSNPLTDPQTREEDFLEHSQKQLLKAIAEEQEKLKKKDEIRNVEAKKKKDEDDSPSSQLPSD